LPGLQVTPQGGERRDLCFERNSQNHQRPRAFCRFDGAAVDARTDDHATSCFRPLQHQAEALIADAPNDCDSGAIHGSRQICEE
jgi:hypothetical protein